MCMSDLWPSVKKVCQKKKKNVECFVPHETKFNFQYFLIYAPMNMVMFFLAM